MIELQIELYNNSFCCVPCSRSALETFSLAVLLTSLTTLRCLCVLGPNVQAWIRVFSRHGYAALALIFPCPLCPCHVIQVCLQSAAAQCSTPSLVFRAMSVWDTCLQITVACTVVGAWVGAFPIPLDWDRPWQVSTHLDFFHL